MPVKLNISTYIRSKCPKLILACLSATVRVEVSSPELLSLIDQLVSVKKGMDLDDIKDIPAIKSSREAYKALGKEPSRYRLSAEALHRRVIRGLGLYQINNVVDIINYISLKSGYSIGGYDRECIEGAILLDAGLADDVYESIGRGLLNVENLPVLRDSAGAFGSPTSDSARTLINENTRHILLVFFDFDGKEDVHATVHETAALLKQFASADEVNLTVY